MDDLGMRDGDEACNWVVDRAWCAACLIASGMQKAQQPELLRSQKD